MKYRNRKQAKLYDDITQTLSFLDSKGFVADRTQHYSPYSGRRNDFLQMFDAIAALKGQGCIGLQTTVAEYSYKHKNKLRKNPKLLAWLAAGCRCQIWRWKSLVKGENPAFIEEAVIKDGKVVFVPVVIEDWIRSLASSKSAGTPDYLMDDGSYSI